MIGSGAPRVLYSFPHTLGEPGIATTAWHQVRGLLDAGVDVTVMCTWSTAAEPRARIVRTLNVAGRRLPHRALGMDRAYAFHDAVVARHLRRNPGAYDVVHVWPRSCLRTVAAARRVGVTSAREAPSPHTTSALREANRAAAERGLSLPRAHSHAQDAELLRREDAEFAAADLILVPSDYAWDTFVAEGVPEHKLVRTRYGFDPERFTPRERAADHRFTALFLGRGEPNKGLHIALDAWFRSGAPELGGRLQVAGRIWDEYGAQLADQLAHPSVEVLGFVSDTPALVAGADVLLLPSYTEGSALVTYEALGAGCVPLVSAATGAPVRDGVDGLVHTVGDVGALTAHLASVSGDPARLAALRSAAVQARDGLTWAAAGRRLAGVYRDVAAGRTRAA